ncbi:adenosine deaminase 2-like [Chrysoperla carnea]|uniref:adenosine deaminase 2-like n=1 Tax=Chrysoperla carnea TaxID=189513 RepID=UPI001D07F83F|nr:adenosine deaminase 2-like [Chrysoperla carnea]
MNYITLFIKILIILQIIVTICALKDSDYWQERQNFINQEKSMQMGNGIHLNPKEDIVNQVLMSAKYAEFDAGLEDPSSFLPTINFLEAKPLIEQSKVFQLIKEMPKGAVLHAHDSAIGSEDVFYNLTFMDNLYFCNTTQGEIRFTFSDHRPRKNLVYAWRALQKKPFRVVCSEWKLLKDERAKSENVKVLNDYIKSKLTLRVADPNSVYTDVNVVWNKFRDIFSTVIPLVTYRPALEKYWFKVFQELYEDHIMYLEFRGTLPPAYDLNGTTYDEIQVAGMYLDVLNRFKQQYPKFHGARFIYAPYRRVNNQTCDRYLNIIQKLSKKYPDFIAGFDLVGQEDQGEPLSSFADKIKTLPNDIRFFFHSGETNWYGESDMNLIDAILLGTVRIGHGYALTKHPAVLQLVKEERIGIEVSPISNQVLHLVQDLRNHPAAGFIAQNLPVVISNDDPGFWGAKGLSYDFYEAFMAFTSRNADLRVLKQLALNSIEFSAMPMEEQGAATQKFNEQWATFIDKVIAQNEISKINETPVAKQQ